MQRRGEISIITRSIGEEATPLGSLAALEAGDWCFPSYRQAAGFFYWDFPVERAIAFYMDIEPGTIEANLSLGPEADPDVNFAPVYVPLAANIPNAAGSAMYDAFTEDTDVVSLAYIGEGATSEGDFHEGLNFAGVFEAPVVTICQNNQWAISVPAERQTAAATFAQKAEAHGIPHERVDGNDVLAVYERTKAAVDRARRGEGPSRRTQRVPSRRGSGLLGGA
jgi:TPP-dependent pyruvate/acetoin dehydrogenase alpha subunit